MAGASRRWPAWAHIGELRLQTFDLEPERGPARKNQSHRAGRSVGLGKLDRQKIENTVLLSRIYVLAFTGQNALEAQRGPAPPEFIAGAVRAFPVETIEPDNKTPFFRPPMHIGNLDDGVLQVGRSDLEIFLVKDHEFQRVHGVSLLPRLVRRGPSAAQDGQAPEMPAPNRRQSSGAWLRV